MEVCPLDYQRMLEGKRAFITTGAQGTDLAAYPLAGSVFRAKAGVRGAPTFVYRG